MTQAFTVDTNFDAMTSYMQALFVTDDGTDSGTKVLSVNGAGDEITMMGKVGIGTNSPSTDHNFHIKGKTLLEGNTSVIGKLMVSDMIELNNKRITGLGDPDDDYDAVHRKFVENYVSDYVTNNVSSG